jgi:dipeptidyl aminopeptidase/acylaminoacyl peptidase
VRVVRPEDLELMNVPSSPTLHGDVLLVAVSRPDPEGNSYRGGLHRVALDGRGPLRWTWGEHDTSPVVSPDGRWVAFLRRRDRGERPQLHVMPVDGGDARRLTNLPLGAGAPVWAPDSRRIAFTARVPESGRYGTPTEPGGEAPEPSHEAPRWIGRLDYRIDDVGFLGDRHARLFVVDVGEKRPTAVELTDGRCDVAGPVWTPEGTHLVVVAPRDLGATETRHDDLYAVPAAGGQPVLLARLPGHIDQPTVTPDGAVVFLGSVFDEIGAEANNHGLWSVPFRLDGSATPRRLTDPETVDCEPRAGRPVSSGGELLIGVRHRGAVELRRIPADADEATLDTLPVVLGERASVAGFTAHDGRVAAVVSTPESPGEVVLAGPAGVETLTDFAAELRSSGLHELREITATAPDGYPVHGWLVTPAGPGPHPVLLCVHGGPFMYHGWGFFDEAQVYASAGYAVLLPNPRGSAGYGQAHGRAIVRALTTVDVDDVLALLDVALSRPDCDADRVGVMGGSYGGFVTSWLASHHGERFRAAWSERAVNAWDSFCGASDIGWYFADGYVGPDPAVQRALSPVYHADRVRIPFAVVHSEEDWRCPLEQAQRMFVALRRAGAPAEMLIFPGEGHELSRSGQPRHRVQRLAAVLDWWSRHIKP